MHHRGQRFHDSINTDAELLEIESLCHLPLQANLEIGVSWSIVNSLSALIAVTARALVSGSRNRSWLQTASPNLQA